ncbi:MAG: AI-2E family transporter, partial [Bacteroidota bacterium]
MPAGNFSIQRLAYYLICLCIAVTVLYVGSSFFVPLVYGLFFALMLKPICDRIERGTKNRVVAILLSMLLVGLTLGGVLYFFASQIMEVIDRADNIMASLEDSWSEMTEWCGELVGLDRSETGEFVERNLNEVVEEPWNLVSLGLTTSGQVLASLALMIIYCFFFLLYSTAFKRFLLSQFNDSAQRENVQILRNIQSVATDYLS